MKTFNLSLKITLALVAIIFLLTSYKHLSKQNATYDPSADAIRIADEYIDCVNRGECEEVKKCENSVTVDTPRGKVKVDCETAYKVKEVFGHDEKMFATILQESNFDKMAVNKHGNTCGVDRGILQLNSCYWKFKDGDLEHNLQQGLQCKKENGYECWTGYKTGAYKQFIPAAKTLLSHLD